jgi:hypothetical protein
MAKSNRRPDPFDRPLDATLERLRILGLPYRPHFAHVDRWVAVCPCCQGELHLREPFVGSAVTVSCDGGCHESRIVAALAAEPPNYDVGLSLAEEASDIAHRALEIAEQPCR